jgi:hypothetical protein
MAKQLTSLANSTTDPTQKAFLTSLANKFQTASTSGDVSDLMPKHHHHHGDASATSSSTSDQDSTSTLGVVSGSSSTGSTTSTSTSSTLQQELQSLFQSFDQQVASAYSGSTTSTSTLASAS